MTKYSSPHQSTNKDNLHQPKNITVSDFATPINQTNSDHSINLVDGNNAEWKNIERKNLEKPMWLFLGGLGIVLFILIILRLSDNNSINVDQVPVVVEPPIVEETVDNQVLFESFSEKDSAYEISYQLPVDQSELSTIIESEIKEQIENFKSQADLDREYAVAELGELPSYLQRPYIYDSSLKLVESPKYGLQSIVQSIYIYTGGANGTGIITSIVSDESNVVYRSLGELVPITNRGRLKEIIITALEQKEFGEGNNVELGSQILFPQQIQQLSLSDVPFSIDDTTLITYFSEGLVGPGVVGAFEVKIKLTPEIERLLDLNIS